MYQMRPDPRSARNSTLITAGLSGSKRNSARIDSRVSSSIWSSASPTLRRGRNARIGHMAVNARAGTGARDGTGVPVNAAHEG